ncbi:MAG: dTMP kinase, partial [Candidatus Aenigmatarchaeota archaeon]
FERLKKEGRAVEYVDFPQYGHPSAAMIEEFLNGRLGPPSEIPPKVASIFYAVDRYAKSAEMWKWLREGKIIICNRYLTSNKGHQAGKIKDAKEIDAFLEWLDELEYGIFGIPRPDKVFFIRMPPKIAQKLIEKKSLRGYLNGKGHDEVEKDVNYLVCSDKAYMYVAKKEGWTVIDGSDGKEPYSIEEIQKKVYEEAARAIEA